MEPPVSRLLSLLADDLANGGRFLSSFFLYGFSLLGLCLVPSFLGKKAWAMLGAFAFVLFFFLFAPPGLSARNQVLVFLAFAQLPWILVLLDLVFQGRLRNLLLAVPLRQLLAWQSFRLMFWAFIPAGLSLQMPREFVFAGLLSETLSALLGLLLLLGPAPEAGPSPAWYRFLLVFWNGYGLVSALWTSVKIAFSHRQLGLFGQSAEISDALLQFPQIAYACFWLPLLVSIHWVCFFRLYSNTYFKTS